MSAKLYIGLAVQAFKQGKYEEAGNLFAAACESKDIHAVEKLMDVELESVAAAELPGLTLSAIASEIAAGMESTSEELDIADFDDEDIIPTGSADDTPTDVSDVNHLVRNGIITDEVATDTGDFIIPGSVSSNDTESSDEELTIEACVQSPVQLA